MPQELWVADIHDDCILGLDFLQSHKCLVNLKDGALTTGGEEIPLKNNQLLQSPLVAKLCWQSMCSCAATSPVGDGDSCEDGRSQS